MGLDYAQRVARSYRKGLDRVRVEAATPTLFTQQPDCAPRSYAAEILKGQNLTVETNVASASMATTSSYQTVSPPLRQSITLRRS